MYTRMLRGPTAPVNTETKDPELKQALEAPAPPQADKSISDTPKETKTDEGQMVGESARNKIRTKNQAPGRLICIFLDTLTVILKHCNNEAHDSK